MDSMLRALGVTGALLVALTGCGRTDAPPASGDTGSVDLKGTWTADSIDSDTQSLVPGTTIRVTFDGGGGDNVRLQAGCNTMSGRASMTDGRLVIDNFGGTEMGCEQDLLDQDTWLGEFFTGSPRLARDDTGFTLASDTASIRFGPEQPAPDVPLQGTVWKLDSIMSGGGANGTASSVPTDARDPQVRFTDGARGWDVRFSTGCNSGGGPVRVGEEVMDFGALVTTKMACAGAAGALEKAFLGVLGNGTTYAVDGDRLTLTAADGASGLVFRAG